MNLFKLKFKITVPHLKLSTKTKAGLITFLFYVDDNATVDSLRADHEVINF